MRLPLTLRLKPPLALQVAVGAGHVLALAVLWPADFPIVLRLAVWLLLLVSASASVLRLQTNRLATLTLKSERRVEADIGGHCREGAIVPGGTVTPYLVVLRVDAGDRLLSLPISADMLDREAFRQLRVWLRWSESPAQEARRYS